MPRCGVAGASHPCRAWVSFQCRPQSRRVPSPHLAMTRCLPNLIAMIRKRPGRRAVVLPGPSDAVSIKSGAAEALAAVEAFVAGAVAHGHMAAVRAGGGVLLEV